MIFQEATFSIATAISEAGTAIGEAMGVAWDLMTSNELMILALGVAVVSMGFGFFRLAKRAMGGGI